MNAKQLLSLHPTTRVRDIHSKTVFTVAEVSRIVAPMVITEDPDADMYADRFEEVCEAKAYCNLPYESSELTESVTIRPAINSIPKTAVQRQFSDRAEADWKARDFLTQGLKVCISRPIELKWIDLEGEAGCLGVVTSGDKIVATATVLYDRAGGAMIAGVIFCSK